MTTPGIEAAFAAVDAHFDTFVTELRELCRIRSRRHEPEQMARAADLIAGSLRRWGGSAEVIPWDDSHPYVLGEIGATARPAAAPASLQRPDGTVTVDGFYDGVREPTGEERRMLEDLHFDGEFLRTRAGVGRFTHDLDDRQAAVAIPTRHRTMKPRSTHPDVVPPAAKRNQ